MYQDRGIAKGSSRSTSNSVSKPRPRNKRTNRTPRCGGRGGIGLRRHALLGSLGNTIRRAFSVIDRHLDVIHCEFEHWTPARATGCASCGTLTDEPPDGLPAREHLPPFGSLRRSIRWESTLAVSRGRTPGIDAWRANRHIARRAAYRFGWSLRHHDRIGSGRMRVSSPSQETQLAFPLRRWHRIANEPNLPRFGSEPREYEVAEVGCGPLAWIPLPSPRALLVVGLRYPHHKSDRGRPRDGQISLCGGSSPQTTSRTRFPIACPTPRKLSPSTSITKATTGANIR